MIKRLYNKFRTKRPKYPKEYLENILSFKKLDLKKRLELNEDDLFPCLNDNTENTGFDAHYIYHPAWAARMVREINPKKHVDISSTLAFSTMLSAFVSTEFYDYRPAELNLDNLLSAKADLTNLSFETNSIESLSCMHTVEHVGLGRYGDPLDPEGDTKAINELKRVVKPGGSLLFVVPVGKSKIVFNAHRIYAPIMIVNTFRGFELKNFALIDDQNNFIANATLDEASVQNYGCGCFWFIKN